METINFDPVDARTLAEEKLLYERFWCLLNDRQLMHLFAKYGPALFRRSSAYIDGDHAHDTELDWSLVERCHRVLLHEHWDAQPSVRDKVRQFICDRSGALTTSNKWALWTA